MFDFINYSTKPKYYDDWKNYLLEKMKDETGSVAIEEFVKLTAKMYLFLVESNWEHKTQNVWIQMLLQQYVIIKIKMFCWIINISDTEWIELKVKTIE